MKNLHEVRNRFCSDNYITNKKCNEFSSIINNEGMELFVIDLSKSANQIHLSENFFRDIILYGFEVRLTIKNEFIINKK